jgi:hypothetical protein
LTAYLSMLAALAAYKRRVAPASSAAWRSRGRGECEQESERLPHQFPDRQRMANPGCCGLAG